MRIFPRPIVISDVQLTAASKEEARLGLLGWIRLVVNDTLRIDGVTLRRTRRGRLTLSFPAKNSLTGVQFFYIRPLDDAARQDIEQQVFAALGLEVKAIT